MSMLDEALAASVVGVSTAQRWAFRDELARRFWLWYHEHATDVVLERRVAFWSVKVRVRDLRPVFERIFGPATLGVP